VGKVDVKVKLHEYNVFNRIVIFLHFNHAEVINRV
jgi:hypothetical protein